MAGQIPHAAEQKGGRAVAAAGQRGTVLSVRSRPGYDKLPPQLPVAHVYADATRIVNDLFGFSGELSRRFAAAGLLPVQWAETLLARAMRVMRLNYNAVLGVLMCTVDGRRRQAPGVHAALLTMLAACQWGLPAKSARDLGLIGLLCDWGGPALAAEAAALQGQAAGEAAAARTRLPTGRASAAVCGRNAPDSGTARAEREAQAGRHDTSPASDLADHRIAFCAHIPALARSYAALIGVLPHAAPLPPHQALAQMRDRVDPACDAQVLEHFIRCLGIYPVGGVVETLCGQRGLVIENTPDAPHLLTVRPLRPAAQRAALGPEPSRIWQAAQIAKAYPLIAPLNAT